MATVATVVIAGCSGGDTNDVVMVDSEEFALTCSAVRDDARSDPADAKYRPAGGGATTTVTVHTLDGLPRDEIVGVTGPADVICVDGDTPGSGVAFSFTTDIETVNEKIEPLLERPS